MGAGIRAGRYGSPVVSNDIAPTLSHILGIPKPSAAPGRVLTQMYAK
jgi:arylsulfatase A-like enzyme